MDKLIEVLAGKRIVTRMIVLFIAFAFLPSFLLVFMWNRDLFCMLDLWKLVLLSTSIGMMLGIVNFILVYFVDNIYVALTGKVNELYYHEEENIQMKYMFYYFMALVLDFLEIVILILIKVTVPSVTVGILLGIIEYSILLFFVLLMILKGVAFIKNKSGNKKVSQ